MGDANITASTWRQVELGRVVLFTTGPFEGRLAAIAEIIDHKRVRLLESWSDALRTFNRQLFSTSIPFRQSIR